MYFASGDNSGVEPPASDPYAITVGGTTVGLGKANNRLFETGWSTDGYVLSGNGKSWTEQKEMGAASGGASLVWAQPAYQAGVVPAALATPSGDRGLARAVPDISADGDPLTGIAVYGIDPAVGDYGWQSSAGTSLAAPLVAGLLSGAVTLVFAVMVVLVMTAISLPGRVQTFTAEQKEQFARAMGLNWRPLKNSSAAGPDRLPMVKFDAAALTKELGTVNEELHHRLNELSVVNDDFTNIMAAEIAVQPLVMPA